MFCPNCGSAVTEDSCFCGECGWRLQETGKDEEAVQGTGERKDTGEAEETGNRRGIEKPGGTGNRKEAEKPGGTGNWRGMEEPGGTGNRKEAEKPGGTGNRKEAEIPVETENRKEPGNGRTAGTGIMGYVKWIISLAGCVVVVLGITGKLDGVWDRFCRTVIFREEPDTTDGNADTAANDAQDKNDPESGPAEEKRTDGNDAFPEASGETDGLLQTDGLQTKGDGVPDPEEGNTDDLRAEAESGREFAVGEPETQAGGEQEPEGASVPLEGGFDEWAGDYARTKGPGCSLVIWYADESGVEFAAGIGGSGWAAYRDLRDCSAEWTDDTTAVYNNPYGGTIELHFMEDHTISVEEKGIDTDEFLPLTGLYDIAENIDLWQAEFVLENSDCQIISEDELKGLSPLECKIARNEIYARHGRLFQDEQLQNYFDSCLWYEGKIPAEEFELDMLNDFEKENANIISGYEEKMGYR